MIGVRLGVLTTNEGRASMTTITHTARPPRRWRTLTRAGVLPALIAGATTTLIAVAGRAADVRFAADGKEIPLGAFAEFTVIGAILGVGIALATRTRSMFVAICAVATAASLAPCVALPDDGSSKALLVLMHVVAAAVIVPGLARADVWGDR
jgi:hypothetical protein